MHKKLIIFFILIINSNFAIGNINVYDLRFWNAPDHTRVVFDVKKGAKYKIFKLTNPNRIVVDIERAYLTKKALNKLKYRDKRINKIRSGNYEKKLRIVIDSSKDFKVKSFTLAPNKHYTHYRIIVDLSDKVTITKKIKKDTDKKIIMIDAGHGGEDPGAIGYYKSLEKNIVLKIAKKLKNIINSSTEYKAILSRKGDYYIPLVKRVRLAQQSNADLFISIHADAVKRRSAKGASVYTLSKKGDETPFAKKLRMSQNASDIFGGVGLDISGDKNLNSILWDFSKVDKDNQSKNLAQKILKYLKKIGRLHKKRPQKASFVVLKAPTIPSVLVETAFISNLKEEKRLRDNRHQLKIAEAIFKGVKDYFKN